MTKFTMTEKALNAGIDGVIKSSVNHAAELTKWTVASVLYAAEHGQCGPLTRLHKEVSVQDAEGIRVFIVNMNLQYAVSVTDSKGVEKAVSFLKFNKENGFTLNTSGDENVMKGIKASKASILKAGEEKLSEIRFGKLDRDAAMSEAFDSIKAVKRLVMTLARNGDAAFAREINRLLGNNAYTVGEIDTTAKNNDPTAKLADLKARQDKLEKLIANNASRAPVVPTSAAVN